MSPKKKKTLLLIAGLHLLLVACGAFELRLHRFGMPGSWLEWYGLVSGSSSGYGFFAPGVGTSLRARFEVVDKNGKTFIDTLETGTNREADLRVGNIVSYLAREVQNEKSRRSIGASFAASMFNRHAGAQAITVYLETFDVPSMKDYSAGMRFNWERLYKAKFVASKK